MGAFFTYFRAVFLLDIHFNPEDGGLMALQSQLSCNKLNGVIFQKTVRFMITALRNSHPTLQNYLRFPLNPLRVFYSTASQLI
jgi:hypothetical protein